MTVPTLQTVLPIALISIWLIFSIVFLISSIQNFINDRKREKEQVEHDREYHEKRMKALE